MPLKLIILFVSTWLGWALSPWDMQSSTPKLNGEPVVFQGLCISCLEYTCDSTSNCAQLLLSRDAGAVAKLLLGEAQAQLAEQARKSSGRTTPLGNERGRGVAALSNRLKNNTTTTTSYTATSSTATTTAITTTNTAEREPPSQHQQQQAQSQQPQQAQPQQPQQAQSQQLRVVPTVRLPLTAEYWLGDANDGQGCDLLYGRQGSWQGGGDGNTNTTNATSYADYVDAVTELFTASGIVVILDLHWSLRELEQTSMALEVMFVPLTVNPRRLGFRMGCCSFFS
jgi:hypothetical protein